MPPLNRQVITRQEFNRRWEQLLDRIERILISSTNMVARSAGVTTAAAVAEVRAARRVRIGVGPVPALILGGAADVVITWSTPFDSTDYALDVTPAMGLIGKGTVSVKTKTATSVTVTVSASALISLGTSYIIAVGAA